MSEAVHPGDPATRSSARAARRVDPSSPGPLERGVTSTGHLVEFTMRLVRELPLAVRLYPTEVLRHAGLLIRANSMVILFMVFMLGAVMGLTAHFLYTNIGIDSYIASVNAIAGMRGMIQVVFGWILAAKVGCGIVAELGAMRISEEIDAMEVMGVRSLAYLAGTRLVAAIIVIPALFVISISLNFAAGYLFNVELVNTASEGAFVYFLFLFQNMRDFVIAVVWGLLVSVIVVVVACYYGYTASGGPVGVGRGTAQSMLVNLVLISITAMMLVQLFYGNSPNAPIGN